MHGTDGPGHRSGRALTERSRPRINELLRAAPEGFICVAEIGTIGTDEADHIDGAALNLLVRSTPYSTAFVAE